MILEHKGITVFYTDQGHGKAIVLLHGFLENSSMWNAFIPELTKNNRVVCIDLLGHGQTECLGYVHTMEMMAEAVETVLKYLGINKTTFICHSMGGYVALAFAENNSDKINGICLANSTARADGFERKKNRDRAIKAVKHNHKTFISMAIANLFRPKNRKIFSEEIIHLKNEALKTPLQGIIAALEGMKIRDDRNKFFANSSFKKIMIISQKDPVLDYDSLIKEAKSNKAKIVEFPDGHMSFVENEGLFLHNIVHFIENI